MKPFSIALTLATIACCTAAHAQSTLQCHQAPNGEYVASLIWQNTLGTRRANEICRNQAQHMHIREEAPAKVAQAPSMNTPASRGTGSHVASHFPPAHEEPGYRFMFTN